MDNPLYESFQFPPEDYCSRPFWAWNGGLTERELLRQIRVFQEMGFGGFFMHSRTGLDTEYLGEEWFRLTRACVREGKKQGLQPWIYDEDRWPSGPAGGIVTKEEQYRRRVLTLSFTVDEKAPLAMFAGRVSSLRLECGWRRIQDPAALLPGETLMVFTVHLMEPQSTYNGFTDVDRLNRAATERFLEVTHKQYEARCGKDFKDIVGVFTDEPHRGMVFSEFSDQGEDKKWSLPWTDDLPQVFADTYGSDLLEQLPALFLQPEGNPVVKVKWQYMELLQKLFIERFLQPIQAWTQKKGMKTTGHFLHEDTLMAQAVPCGSVMRCYPYLDEPGIDSLTDNRYIPWAIKALESVARQLEKPFKLSELYGATGWHMSFQDYKFVTDWQIILGINVRCPHLSWYTMKGEAKRDYPGSFLHQATWYGEHKALETYFARLSVAATSGKPVCDTLVIHPVESLWCQIHPGWADGFDGVTPAVKGLERDFVRTFNYLMEAQKDFDYGDEGLLAEYAAVERGVLRVGAMEYRQVVVSGCLNIRSSTYRLLKTFQDQGGQLLFIGIPPRFVDCEKTRACHDLAHKGVHIPLNRQAVVNLFRQQPSPVKIQADVAKNFYLQLRQAEDGLTAVLWNKSRSRSFRDLEISVPKAGSVALWDCFTGEKNALPVQNGQVKLDFAPGQERVLRIGRQAEVLPIWQARHDRHWTSLGQPTGYALDEDNVYVLDMANLWLEDQQIAGSQEILELDRMLRTRLGFALRGGEMLQPWAREKKTFAGKSIRLQYSIEMEVLPGAPLTLALEPMEGLRLSVNGKQVKLERKDRFWVDNCYTLYQLPCDIWKLGSNTLEVTATYGEESGLEAMFLLGSFGVWFREHRPVIGSLPENLKIGDIVKQGLAFYSGKVTYRFDLPQRGAFALHLPKVGGSCTLATCGRETKMIPWAWETPTFHAEDHSVEIQVVLNRHNTFGPLHRFPPETALRGPGLFYF